MTLSPLATFPFVASFTLGCRWVGCFAALATGVGTLAASPVEPAAAALTPAGRGEARWLADHFGVTHSGGKYSVPTRPEGVDYLNEGADRVAELGSRTLKLWFNHDPRNAYPNFDGRAAFNWPAVGLSQSVNSLTALASLPFYRAAFERSAFETYFLVATEIARVTWRDGLTVNEEVTVAIEFRNLTLHLIDTYAGSGKTFILQNWEGDNLLNLAQFESGTWDGMAEGMIAYMKARQRGIAEARALRPDADVKVWHCLEINYNPAAANPDDLDVPDEWTVVNRVVRDGYATAGLVSDLYSWSSWSGKIPGQEFRLLRGLDYLRARVPTEGPLAPDNVLIGEFGAYENSFMPTGERVFTENSAATYSQLVANLYEYAWRGGARHAVFWALYSNGLRNGVTFSAVNPVSLTQQDLVGTWLIRPPGPPSEPIATFTPAYFHFAEHAKRRLLVDDLVTFDRVVARSAGWSSTTSPQAFAPGVRARAYRTANTPSEWLVFGCDDPLIDVNVPAFHSGSATPAAFLRATLSVDGETWSEPFALTTFDEVKPDPANLSWTRSLLRLPFTPAADVRYLRLAIAGDFTSWALQLGGVTLVTAPPAPAAPTAPRQTWGLVGAPLTVSVSGPTAPGPFTYTWWKGDALVATTSTPALQLTGSAAENGDYSVVARSPAGASPPARLAVRLVTSWTDDDDHDGRPNLLAWALGDDAAGAPPLTVTPAEAGGTLTWTYDPAAAVRLTVEASDHPNAWTEIAARAPGGVWSGSATITTEPAPDGRERATLQFSTSSSTRFHRLRATLP